MPNNNEESGGNVLGKFSSKVVKAVGITILMVLLTLFFIEGFKILLLLLAAVMVAIFFHGVAGNLQKFLPIKNGLALVISLFLVFGGITFLIHLLSPSIAEQIQIMKEEIPAAYEKISADFKKTDIGGFVNDEIFGNGFNPDDYSQELKTFFSSVFGVIADIYIIFFLSMFLMFQPHVYRKGVIKLFPKPKRKRAEQVLLTLGYNLKRWLLGRLTSMAFIGVFTWIGLLIMDIPMALTLALFSGLLTLVPNFGPIVALIPALMIAMLKGMDYALFVFILYTSLQATEANLITPFIQHRMIRLPLAMILFAQVILGLFSGVLGLILAVPIVAIAMVLVKMLYIEDVLKDEDVKVKGEERFS